MLDILHREFVYIWYYFDVQLRQIVFYWAIGILIGSVISVFGKQKIHSLMNVIQDKHLGEPYRHRVAAVYVRNNPNRRVVFAEGYARRLPRGVYDEQYFTQSTAFNLQCRSR